MEALTKENKALMEKVKKRKVGSDSSDEEDPDVVVRESHSPEEKAARIRAALPLHTNEAFLSIISDPVAEQVLQGILQEAMLEGLAKGEFTLDTSAKSRSLSKTVIHTLFSDDYIDRYRFYNPRENYNQAEGTAMVQAVYDWLHDTVLTLVAEVITREGVERAPFDWDEFLTMLRDSWKWSRNNIRKKKKRAAKKAGH